MPSKANEFRAQAAECDERARKVTSETVRERYIENARWWRELAAQTERQQLYIDRHVATAHEPSGRILDEQSVTRCVRNSIRD